MNKKLLATLLAIIAVLTFAAVAFAGSFPLDVGNHNDYGGGSYGGSYGGGSYGGSYSGGYRSSYSSYSDSGSDTDLPLPVVILIVLAVLVFGVIKYLSNSNNNADDTRPNVPITIPPLPNHTNNIINAIHDVDPNFDLEKFISWSKEVFITLQQAWTAKDWAKIRPFENEELYRQHCMQLQEYIDRGQTNYLERINISQAYLFEYSRDREYEHMKVYMSVRMIDYILDDRTGNLLNGSKTDPYFLQYVLTFIRKTGVKTDPATSNMSTTSCPHCGAPTEVTSAGKCEYCGFIITTGEHDWVLSDLSSVKNNANFGNGGIIISDYNTTDNNNTQY